MDRSSKIGVAVICLFALPFAAFGLFALSHAGSFTEQGTGKPIFWLPVLFGVVFSSIGFGLLFLAFFGAKRFAGQQRLQAEHPAEPWLWRADWAAGRVLSKTRGNMIGAWVFAILWNLVSAPVAILVVPAALKQKGPVALIALVFPVAGAFLLIRAIKLTVGFLEFGKTWFEMASVPGIIGRELKGTIHAKFPHSPDHGVHLRLSCVRYLTTGSGNSQSTTESILWRDETDLDPGRLCPGPMGTMIPVAFHIPADAHATERISPREQYVWMVEAMADAPGVDYHDIFEVPVFRTANSPTAAEAAAQEKVFAASAPAVCAPERPTVQVQRTSGGTEFYFPPARNKSFAASTTMFTAIFGALTFFLLNHKVLFLFPLVFGFFSVLLFYISVRLWLGTTRVLIGNSLKVQEGLLGYGKVRDITFTDIVSIGDKITAQQGGGTGTPFYDIQAKLRDGKTVTLGHFLASKREVEWLTSEMRRLTGLAARTAAAGAS
jgi:hypothetical protein